MKKAGIEGLAPSHGDILFRLYRTDALKMNQIAELIDRDKSTVTVLVNKLVRLGFVEKQQDWEDSRVYHIKLTEKGRALEPIYRDISERLIDHIYQHFTEEEQLMLMRLLQKIEI